MVNKRKTIPVNVINTVLHEAGYKCANPTCRNLITLDIHYLINVSEGGPDTVENLLPLCPMCHALHTRKMIPAESIRAWKMLLLALNEAFDRKSIDILLALDKLGKIERLTGDGISDFTRLIASGLVNIREAFNHIQGDFVIGSGLMERMYVAELTEKGKLLVDSWKKGDQSAAIGVSDSAI